MKFILAVILLCSVSCGAQVTIISTNNGTNLVVNGQVTVTNTPMASPLVGWWQLNNSYVDAGGDGYTLTAFNSPTFTANVPTPISGNVSQSLSLTASSTQYAKTSTGITQLGGVSKATICAWVNIANFNVDDFEVGCSTTDGRSFFFFFVENSGVIFFKAESGGFTSYGYVAYAQNGWHHIAMVFDGTQSGNASRLIGYVDAVPQTLTFSGTVPSTLDTTANMGPFYVGDDIQDGILGTGLYSDVRAYEVAETPTQISAIYAGSWP